MRIEKVDDALTDYERAVCYYTLPKVISPLTLGLLFAYALCVVEALAALGYGLWMDSRPWTVAGTVSLVGIIVFGMIAFTARALLNDWNRRLALAAARNTPNAPQDENVPDPFETHVLLSHPVNVRSEVFACVTIGGGIEYYVEVRRFNAHWRVSSPQDQVRFEVLALQGVPRLGFSAPLPARLGVYANKKEIASIVRSVSLRNAHVDVFVLTPTQVAYTIVNGCIHAAGRLVGRVYTLRGNVYLDVEHDHFNEGLLAYFVMLR